MGTINRNINPLEDGISHINMYSKAKTEFGRMLSDFYRYPIHTEDGDFLSVEGYWSYLSLPETVNREKMRNLYGYTAKKTGRELRKDAGEENLLFDDRFEEKILSAIKTKIMACKHLFKEEYKDLPIIHYYILNDGKPYEVTDDFPWLMNGIREIVKDICY